MGLEVGIGAAFLAGLVSFLSPCVLPLVPPYLCFLAGTTLEDLQARQREGLAAGAVAAAIAFVLGFSTVFVALGATASLAGELLRKALAWSVEIGPYRFNVLVTAAGVAIILMGLHFLGVFRFALLGREARYQPTSRPAGLVGAYVIGLAFAFGWTPCIGPVLATILAIASSEESVARGAGLLAVYSAGLGLPFIAAALGINGFLGFFARFRKHLGTVEKAMGVLLVATGVMFLTGTIQAMSYWLLETFPGLATLG